MSLPPKFDVFLHNVSDTQDNVFQIKKWYIFGAGIIIVFIMYMYKKIQLSLQKCESKLPKDQQGNESEDTLTAILGNLISIVIR